MMNERHFSEWNISDKARGCLVSADFFVHCSRISHNSFTLYQPTCVSHGTLLLVFPSFFPFISSCKSRPLCRNYSIRFAMKALKRCCFFPIFYFMLLLKRARGSHNIIIWALYRQINPLHASVHEHPYTYVCGCGMLNEFIHAGYANIMSVTMEAIESRDLSDLRFPI